MLTIKIRDSKDGSELVKCNVKSVMYKPPIFETQRNPLLFVWYGDRDEMSETIHNSDVYIMNENGKTVGNYDVTNRFPEVTESN